MLIFSILCRITWANIGGTNYHKEGVVVLQSNLVPLFGIITDIMVHENQYYFICNTSHMECFNHHFHAYEVSKCPVDFAITTASDVVDHNVLTPYSLSSHSTYFVPMKYHIVENIRICSAFGQHLPDWLSNKAQQLPCKWCYACIHITYERHLVYLNSTSKYVKVSWYEMGI